MKIEPKTQKIVLAGEGGQGIQTIAKALGEAAAISNHNVTYIPIFGVEQRGTPSISLITISDQPIHYPRFDVGDIVVILTGRAIAAVEDYISPSTTVLFDSSTVNSKKLPKRAIRLNAIPATKIATEKYHPKSFNMIILGVLSSKLELPAQVAWDQAAHTLGEKLRDAKVKQMNHDAFMYGYSAVLETKSFSKTEYETKKTVNIYKSHDKIAKIDPSLCKGCGICIEKCPVKALSMGEDLGHFALPVPTIDLNKCIACGNCRRFCPDGAIGVDKTSK